MDAENRLEEAIKQTNLAIEEINQPDAIRELEDGKESLEKARERLGSIEP